MSFSRREFMQVLAVASATGMALNHRDVLAAAPGAGERLYDVPKFGNVSFLHFTDCHAQLTPIYFREPNVNLGVAEAVGRPPHIVGEKLLKQFGLKPGTGRQDLRQGGRLRAHGHARQTAQGQPAQRVAARRW